MIQIYRLKEKLGYFLIIILGVIFCSYFLTMSFAISKSLFIDFLEGSILYRVISFFFFFPLSIKLLIMAAYPTFYGIIEIIKMRSKIFDEIIFYSFSIAVALVIQTFLSTFLYLFLRKISMFNYYFSLVIKFTQFLITISVIIFPILIILRIIVWILKKIKLI